MTISNYTHEQQRLISWMINRQNTAAAQGGGFVGVYITPENLQYVKMTDAEVFTMVTEWPNKLTEKGKKVVKEIGNTLANIFDNQA